MNKCPSTVPAIYARVSSEQQAEAATIDSQVDALQGRIAADGLTLETEMRFLDEGYSGATLIRPALERLRDVAATGAIDRLYVHSPDRLARKYAYQVLLLDELQRCGVEVTFLNHPLGQTPEEDLLLQVQGMVAEYERAKILERSRRGKLHAARQGSVSALSSAPYGYRYVSSREGDGKARYEIVLEEARVIQQMFAWVGRDGLSIGEVCRRLKEQGIPSPTGKSHWARTTVWSQLRIQRIVETRSSVRGESGRKGRVCGHKRVTRNNRDGRSRSMRCPRIKGFRFQFLQSSARNSSRPWQRDWKRIGNAIGNRSVAPSTCFKVSSSVLVATMHSAGNRMRRKAREGNRRDYVYYRCMGTDAYRFGGERTCHNKPVRVDVLDEAVWKDVCSLLEDPARIECEYQRRLKCESGNPENDEHLQARIQKVKRGIVRLVDAYEDGLLEKSDFELRIRRARERMATLEAEVKKQADEESQCAELRLVIGQLQGFATRIKSGLHDADWSTKREIIRALVKRVEVDEAQVRVIYRIDPLPFDRGPERGCLQDCSRRRNGTAGVKSPGKRHVS